MLWLFRITVGKSSTVQKPLGVILIKKILVILVLGAVGIIGLGYLPKEISDRLTKALVAILILGFAIRAGAYFFG